MRFSSRCALSTLSLPCTALRRPSVPNSPRRLQTVTGSETRTQDNEPLRSSFARLLRVSRASKLTPRAHSVFGTQRQRNRRSTA